MIYLLYMSPLGDIIKRHYLDFHFYADDTKLYLAFKPNAAKQPGSIACSEACVRETYSVEKDEVEQGQDRIEKLTLSAHHGQSPSIEHIEISCERIQPSPSAKNMSIIFDQHLSLDQRVTSICKSCFVFDLPSIARIRECLSTTDTETLVHAIITSRLDSCNSSHLTVRSAQIVNRSFAECTELCSWNYYTKQEVRRHYAYFKKNSTGFQSVNL